MAREVASGVDFKIIQLSPGEKADIRTWMKNRRSKCPKTLVDLTQAVYWAAESIHGLDAIVEHTYNNLFAAFQVAFDDFDVQWQSLGELGCLREIQAHLVEGHSQRPNTLHIADFAHKFSLTPANNREDVFAPIKDSLLSQCVSPFDADGALRPRYFFLSQFGFAVIDYYIGKELDCVHPEYRASISGGAHFGMTLRGIVLCDETLAHIADEIELCDFPPNCSHQTKAQVLTAAVGQCFNDNFQSNERALSLAIGVLVYMAYDVIRRLDSELLPKMPAITPYSMDPLPYYDDTTPLEFSLPRDQASTPSLLPSVIPSSSSWPSVVASLASTSVSFMSNIREAAKGLLPKPF
ncbi:hypothetical protein ONZ45_g11851 [Pleurotus djamor]|nr:hypothetical protein ONZ45_g11851 [Pleurotus djamor]